MSESPESVLDFWFGTLKSDDWFVKNDSLDRAIRERFLETHLDLARSVPDEWCETPQARLAQIIVFDQFPRNMFRDTPHAFGTDFLALKAARMATATGADQAVDQTRRAFFYMPFEHSEVAADQDRSVALFEALGDPLYLDYARRHQDVIRRFGRFPHRNALLGRKNTPEEEAYLAEPGAGF